MLFLGLVVLTEMSVSFFSSLLAVFVVPVAAVLILSFLLNYIKFLFYKESRS